MDGVVQLARDVVDGEGVVVQVELGPDGNALGHPHILDLTPHEKLKNLHSVIVIRLLQKYTRHPAGQQRCFWGC